MEQIRQKNFSPVLNSLIKEEFYDELLDRNLTFKNDFSYDVVLTLFDLSKSLGVKEENCDDIKQLNVTEKLGIYPPLKINFRDWIIFNARKQELEIVYGIQVEELRHLIKCDPNKPSKAKELARSYIINAFSMCDAQGTPARHVDLHGFHGSFTPDFYPRRFALKDSIYSQRLDILAALIAHIIDRYQACLPPIRYCEFSISVNDLSRPWMFDVLRSVQVYDETAKIHSRRDEKIHTYIPTNELSSFSQLVLNDHFSHLEFAFTGPESDKSENIHPTASKMTYKFLAGFDRQKIQTSQFKNMNEALRFLLEYPQQAILLMIREIINSKKEAVNSAANEESVFGDFLKKLKNLESKANVMPAFYDWVVGLDLFGDELGYPYCPFVARPFIEYIQNRRRIAHETKSKNIFGVRIHCGENVIFADDRTHTYRLFVAHMYIVFRCLRFIQQELKYGIRIGHGIAFDRILGNSMNKSGYRKSSVLLAELREHAYHLMKTIAFEVNITSNEYLLGQTLRQGDDRQPLRLDGLFGKTPIILATDDDGVWPIDQCPFTHPGHQSLTAEYCRAISSGLIRTVDQLKGIFQDTKNFCFWNVGGTIPKPSNDDALPPDDSLINTVIIHPDIIRRLLKLYGGKTIAINPGFERFACNTPYNYSIKWANVYGALRVAFICICANHDKSDQDEKIKSEIRKEYDTLFGPNDIEFDNIYDFWRQVRCKFIFFNDSETCSNGRHVLLRHKVDNRHLVYAAPQNSDLSQSQDKSLTGFISHYPLLPCTIHAYGNHINIENTMEVLQKLVTDTDGEESYKCMTVYIYTNTNRYTHVPVALSKNFDLKINPHYSKRNKEMGSFLYVLCPNASAATAALHLISRKISPNPSNENTCLMFGVATPTLSETQQASGYIPEKSLSDGSKHQVNSDLDKMMAHPDAKNN
ncbi:unnamed protein product [Rotaria sp. Silwood1]|nr:unnamed protein product [Rotaria sp. Silwood1]CAF3523826.1 unnamed protein product [Rotaria sp. Silwood1]CAF3579854.1 unnamed protein product [Rotaria sp. Silwood1]CAF4683205.1 unnamed protein product [Rotaria sp. Silwood1]CAF4741000.1 unnamed protein product [Rotaria sp. Silwood1]